MDENITRNLSEYRKILETHDFQEPVKSYITTIGMDNFIKMVYRFGGRNIYIPKPSMIENVIIRHLIKKEYDGHNIIMLAEKYGLSTATIYLYLQE